MNPAPQTITYSLNEIETAASFLLEKAIGFNTIAFSGDLGAGKTSLIRAMCKILGVVDNVSSPTFALINEYHYFMSGIDKVIYHMDWYRLKEAEEGVNAGMEDCLLQQDALCFIEWPEHAIELLRPPYLMVSLGVLGNDTRQMKVDTLA